MKDRWMSKYDGSKYGWLKLAKEAAVVAIIAFLIFQFLIGISFVRGNSMAPTLQDGDIVVYLRISSHYDRGDVVSVRMPSGAYYVKRIVAVAGDTVDIRDGKVYLNDAEWAEPYVEGETLPQTGSVSYPYTVGEGSVFVMGDNRPDSMDSRAFGAIVTDQIKGKLLFVD